MHLIFTAHLTKGGFGSRGTRQILIYCICYYGNRRQPFLRGCLFFYALKRIANYDFLLFPI